MAKIPRAVVIRDEEIDDVEIENERERATEADKAAFDFIESAAAFGSEAQIIINRDVNGSVLYLERIAVDQYDYYGLHDYIRNNYGGGDYRLYVTKKGTRGLLQNVLLRIESKAGAIAVPEKQTNLGTNDVALAILAELRDARKNQIALADPMAQMRQSMEMLTMMKTAFGTDKPSNPLTEMMQQMKLMAEMKAMLMDGVEPSQPSVMDKLFEALPQLLPAVATVMASGGRKANPMPPRPQPQPAPKANPVPERDITPPKQEQDTVSIEGLTPEQNEQFKEFIGKGCLAASFGADPEKIAETICDSVAPEQLAAMVALPDLIHRLEMLDARVSKHKDWFVDVVEWVKWHLEVPSKFDGEEEETDDGEPETPNGEVDSE